MKPAPVTNSATTSQVEKKSINQELWQACAGPLVNLPAAGTHVVYFPQGHIEQVAASMKMNVDVQIPNYPNLPSKLFCLLHNVTLHADPDTDEVYARMTLQPVPSFDKEAVLMSDLSLRVHKPQSEFFCKALTASDTSTHGGFSVPRRAADKIFPPLDYSMQPPAQELVARDLHGNVWSFRHIYRGQPKRHLLTTGWSLFVSGKRLFAGDSVLFIRDEKQDLLLGTRRANRQPANLSSSVLSTDSMLIGILAAAAHAAANNSPFIIFYNPRASPSEFVIPLAKYYKANYGQQMSLGMRFRMMFETEESGTRRYMGTITGINDLDPRWKDSQWRSLQVAWDESISGEKRMRVSMWEIEPVMAPFFMCPPPFLAAKRPRLPGMPDNDADFDSIFKRTMTWIGEDPRSSTGLNFMQRMNMQWMNMHQNNLMQCNLLNTLPVSSQGLPATELPRQVGFPLPPILQQTNISFNSQAPPQTLQQLDQSQNSQQQLPAVSQHASQTLMDDPTMTQHATQTLMNPTITVSQVQSQLLHAEAPAPAPAPAPVQNFNSLQKHQIQGNLSHILPEQQILVKDQQQKFLQSQLPYLASLQTQAPDSQLQMQPLHQQSLLSQPSASQPVNRLNQAQEAAQKQIMAHPETQIIPQSIPQSNSQIRLIHQHSLLSQPSASQQVNQYNQVQDTTQKQMLPLPETQTMPQSINKSNCQTNFQFSQLSQIQKVLPQQPGLMPDISVQHIRQSSVCDDIPSCSTSPSTNNCQNVTQTITNSSDKRSNSIEVGINQSHTKMSSSTCLETMLSCNFVKELHQKDYLDSSSATSPLISQIDIISQSDSLSNLQSYFLADEGLNMELQADFRNSIHHLEQSLVSDAMLMKNIPGSSNKSHSNNVSSCRMPSNYENGKDAQQELSSSMVTQSFGVPDMAFTSMDSGISDGSIMNQGSWGRPPQYQRLRTYTKVYKRGAVGRSIDVTRYSDYGELKHDLARMFGLEGQMEHRGRAGWKLVYVDHENDVLLVGDDPWEDFVKCVRYIKILSPQEVQQMSLDSDFGNTSLPNQAYSSSPGGLV